MTMAPINVHTHALTVAEIDPLLANHTRTMIMTIRRAYARKNTPCPRRHTERKFSTVLIAGSLRLFWSSLNLGHGGSAATEPMLVDKTTLKFAVPEPEPDMVSQKSHKDLSRLPYTPRHSTQLPRPSRLVPSDALFIYFVRLFD